MKYIFLPFLIFISINSVAQKAKVKYDKDSNYVIVNDVKSFKIEKNGCGFGSVDCHFDVFDLDGNKVIRINLREIKSLMEISKSNPTGRVVYYEFVFLYSKQKSEIKFMGIKSEKVAKSIVSYNLFEGGKLNQKAVDEFILINGTPFSDRVKF